MNDLSLRSPVVQARDLAGLIAAEADAIESSRRLTEPVLEALHDARLFRMLYPRSVGGDEFEPAVYIDAVGELATVGVAVVGVEDGAVVVQEIERGLGESNPGYEKEEGDEAHLPVEYSQARGLRYNALPYLRCETEGFCWCRAAWPSG